MTMLADKLNLKGKNAFVTGSSKGIGKAIAITLAEYGANVIVHYREEEDEAWATSKEIDKFGVKSFLLQADLSEQDEVQDLWERVHEKVDRVDILVINASVQVAKDWMQITSEDFDLQVTTNFKTTLVLMQSFVPEMVARGWGRILTIGSIQQEKPHPAMIVYAATKSAVLNLVKNVAMQMGDNGVTVNNLAPGVIATTRIDDPVPETDERILKRMEPPVGKTGNPEDCAGMALFLCSEAGNYITGQNIFVDGGMSL
jgi:glucose 1-dehydrogenase